MDTIDEILNTESTEPAVTQEPEVTTQVTPEVTTEVAPAPEATPEKEIPPEKFVPYGALHEERMKRKELAMELKETQASVKQFESLREELMEIRRAKQAETQAQMKQKFDEDPVSALKEQQEQIAGEVTKLRSEQEQGRERLQQQTAQQQHIQELYRTTQTMAAEYAKANPDYQQSLDFVMAQWSKQAAVLGYTNPQEIENALTGQALALSKHAIDRGQNPAQVVHELARAWGFSPKAEKTKETVDDTMARLEKGQQAAKSLASSPGQAADSGLSLKDIENMSDDAFDKMWSDMEKNARKR